MDKNFQDDLLPKLKEIYFSDPLKRLSLQSGDILMDQGEENDRLFLVLEGELIGEITRRDGSRYELFKSSRHMFVGVYSFFSKTFISSARVKAVDKCEVAYIDQNQIAISENGKSSLFDQFMPVVVANLLIRMQNEQEIAFEKEQTHKKLVETEKMAVLGQMAAGIAHELNNAIAVLAKNTNWLQKRLEELSRRYRPKTCAFFTKGFEEGRRMTSREIRLKTKRYQKDFALSQKFAKKLAQTGISDTLVEKYLPSELEITEMNRDWEMGAVLHDMKIAANMATHVVRSVKALAVKTTRKEEDVNLNDTIHEAIILLSSPLRKVEVIVDLGDIPLKKGNRGEWVQVWTNLIRNAAEALLGNEQKKNIINIKSCFVDGLIQISVIDNGPGIPDDVQHKIMQPNFTTKGKGLEFGLGLGLSITSKIVGKYNGDIQITSIPGNTVFCVKIPIDKM